MHLSNCLINMKQKRSIHPTGNTHCTRTRTDEKCRLSASQVYSSTDGHRKPNTEGSRSAQNAHQLNESYEQSDEAKQTHASKQQDGRHSKPTFYTLATSPC
ncbi:hypothetical protein FQA47_022925 [Oryzias melastigma]|uniref:Uncharacterized protein n=1 Tax=Oryzias melastigma TaxID=30732 RepID=A0A834CQ84_ORYME|nr:hypothetical protein FQA47_022925 [Oryzias melastigma]